MIPWRQKLEVPRQLFLQAMFIKSLLHTEHFKSSENSRLEVYEKKKYLIDTETKRKVSFRFDLVKKIQIWFY